MSRFARYMAGSLLRMLLHATATGALLYLNPKPVWWYVAGGLMAIILYGGGRPVFSGGLEEGQ